MILLDTDVCVELLRGNNKVIRRREESSEVVAISFMSAAELFYGVFKSNQVAENKSFLLKFLMSVDILYPDYEILEVFGDLKNQVIAKGQKIADADLFIVATAVTKCSRLVTGNIRHFKKFRQLIVENWIK